MVWEKHYLIKLKIILQSNIFYIIVLIIALLISLIIIKCFPYTSKINPKNTFTGRVTNIKYDGDKYTIYIKDKETIIGYYKKINDDIKLGYVVKIQGDFYKPKNNTIPNTFNYKNYLNNHKIFYQVNIAKLDILSKKQNFIYRIKENIINRAASLKNKGYIKAFIIGDKNDLELYSMYQDNGISHLFALSGMHVNFLVAILYIFFKRLKIKNILIILFLIFYLSLTNYSASLIRSVLFFILLTLNKKLSLNITTKNILLLTVSILIIVNPYIIFDYGFLYSVVVTYGLIISSKYYRKNHLYNLLITSFIAFIYSLPITISMNYEINILTIINNILIENFRLIPYQFT